MVTIKITIEETGPTVVDFRMEGHGEGSTPDEVKMAQRIIRLIQRENKPGIVQVLSPQTETIIPYNDRPQPN